MELLLRLLLLLLAAPAAAAAAAAMPCKRGALVGGDNLKVANMTLAVAQAWCEGDKRCAGFTAESSSCAAPAPSVGGLLHCYFKDQLDANTDARWTTWLKRGYTDPCAVPKQLGGARDQLRPPAVLNTSATAAELAATVALWRDTLGKWRSGCRAQLQLNDSVYEIPALKWTQQSFIQPQVHPWDRFVYDPIARNWTVDRYLADLRQRYGGIDAVLVWPTFPQLGLDDRNQFDYIRSVPGGVPGLRALVAAFHEQGVKVLLPYNPWDKGTRRERCGDASYPCGPGLQHGDLMSDPDAMAALLTAIDADGFNGDTMKKINKDFFDASIAREHPIAMEPEGPTPYPPTHIPANNPLCSPHTSTIRRYKQTNIESSYVLIARMDV